MRCFFGLAVAWALSVAPLVGCSDATVGGGNGGMGGMPECASAKDCGDSEECTERTCIDGVCGSALAANGVACTADNECVVGTCTGGTCESTNVADEAACAGDAGRCQQGSCKVACTEQGIRDAVATGGGGYTFDCDGLTTVVTKAEIAIDKDVILDGEGKLTIDAECIIGLCRRHRAFSVAKAVRAELRGFTVTGAQRVSPHDPWSPGSIHNEGTLVLTTSTVSGNEMAGINNTGGTLTVLDSILSDNDGYGATSSGTLTLTNSTVSGNYLDAVHNDGGSLTVSDSTLSGNRLSGIINIRGMATITNTTVSGNDGGIASPGSVLRIASSTISGTPWTVFGNTVGDGRGSFVEIYASVIDGPCDQPDDDPVTWTSNGYNVKTGGGHTCGIGGPETDQLVVTADLNLGPLADNGGPTMTLALLPGSVAIDVIPEVDCVDLDGAPLTTDQRGQPRPETGGSMCDVGASEVQP
ncbi:MAG: right-handed parallel beta-helix repeat-containing protein [Myxococcales bacterium]|nr:right-handed parallel beta-helix repeat-containing protein [Myxococcales bacterium]